MDELKVGHGSDDLTLKVTTPLTLNLNPQYVRQLLFECGEQGPALCPACDIHSVTEAFICSSFPGESEKKCVGRKCQMCGWRGPCEVVH